MKNGFCVILTKYRVYQGIALYRSLHYKVKNPRLFMLCVDDEAYQVLSKLNLKNTSLIRIHEIENEILLVKKQERRLNEYCWTLKPFLLEYVLHKFLEIDWVTYVDADICFFSDIKPIFNQGANFSVLLSKHDYSGKYLEAKELCGTYNSGFLSFKRDENASNILQWWKERCLEWCYDRAEDGKFGDQKYLDRMPLIFPGVSEIQTPGVNIGPWNDSKYNFAVEGNKVYMNGKRLICYHFAGFRLLNKDEFALILDINKKLIPFVYKPYMLVLQNIISHIEAVNPLFNGFFIENNHRKRVQIHKMNS
jgi:hypothetical protein